VAVEVGADGTSRVTVLAGDVTFFNTQGSVEVTGGQQSTAVPGQAPTPPVVVDVTGLIAWTADVAGMPLVYETPNLAKLARTPAEDQAQALLLEAQTVANPNDEASWIGLAGVRSALGDTTGALDAYTRAAAIVPNDENARIGMALEDMSQGNEGNARIALQPVANQPDAIAALGLLDLEQGDIPASQAQFRQALAQDPKLYTAESLLALDYLSQADLRDAETSARAGVAIEPDSAQTEGVLSTVLFFEGKTGEAGAAARSALRSNPLSPFALLAEGRVLTENRQYDKACAEYEKASAIAPSVWLLHEELGNTYLQLDMPRKAAEEFQIALRLNAGTADAHVGNGEALQRLGRYDQARAEYEAAIALSPSDATARYYFAAFLVDRGDLDGALSQIRGAMGKAGQFGLLYAKLAEIYVYKQDLHDAQIVASEGVKALPNSAIAHYELGRVFLEQQHTYQAQQEFRIATTLDSRLTAARYALGLTEEKTGSGPLAAMSSVFESALVGSPASALDLTNLQTPGANERIQAALQDPTAVRSATRSYGDAEVDGMDGTLSSHDVAASYLTETSDSRGVAGVSGQQEFDHGVRADADTTLNEASFVLGQKAEDKPAGYLLLGDYEQTDKGDDTGVTSNPIEALARSHTQLALLTCGVNEPAVGGGQFLAILQASNALEGTRSSVTTSNPNYITNHLSIQSLDGEVRWDVDPGQHNDVSIGASYGDRYRSANSLFNMISPPPILLLEAVQVQPFQAYARDTVRCSDRVSFAGQLQYLQQNPYEGYSFFGIPGIPPMASEKKTELVLPYAVVSYTSGAHDVIRVRYRRIAAQVTDFQLISPTDEFLLDYSDLLAEDVVNPSGTSSGSSTEAEWDKSLSNASFLSVGAFRQDLQQVDTSYGTNPYPYVRVQGAQASYQGALSRTVTFFTLAELADAEDTQIHQRIPETPKYNGIATLQYLNTAGCYGQCAFYVQGDRLSGDTPPETLGGFGLLNVRIGKRAGLRSDVYAELDNVFNRTYDQCGILQAGREVRVGAALRY
jgi:tetratricopeptide (TPR) repeat protein